MTKKEHAGHHSLVMLARNSCAYVTKLPLGQSFGPASKVHYSITSHFDDIPSRCGFLKAHEACPWAIQQIDDYVVGFSHLRLLRHLMHELIGFLASQLAHLTYFQTRHPLGLLGGGHV